MNMLVSTAISATPNGTTRPQVRIVIVGHVDHGKSTLVGRLLHETESLPEGKLEMLKAVSARRGMPFEWSFLLDALQTERDQGITIDTTQIRFRTRSRDVVLIDAPGHAEFLRNMFSYIFDAEYKYGGLAQVELNPIDGPVELFGARFEPVIVKHGNAEIIGFRFGTAAYLTDFSEIPEESFTQLKDLDILFLDALRHRPHPTHSTVDNSLRIVERLKPKRAFFTHICHDLPHAATNATLPKHVQLSYDGMKLEFEI